MTTRDSERALRLAPALTIVQLIDRLAAVCDSLHQPWLFLGPLHHVDGIIGPQQGVGIVVGERGPYGRPRRRGLRAGGRRCASGWCYHLPRSRAWLGHGAIDAANGAFTATGCCGGTSTAFPASPADASCLRGPARCCRPFAWGISYPAAGSRGAASRAAAATDAAAIAADACPASAAAAAAASGAAGTFRWQYALHRPPATVGNHSSFNRLDAGRLPLVGAA